MISSVDEDQNHKSFVKVLSEIEKIVAESYKEGKILNQIIFIGLAENQDSKTHYESINDIFCKEKIPFFLFTPEYPSRNNFFDYMSKNSFGKTFLLNEENMNDSTLNSQHIITGTIKRSTN